eukprot:17794-Heterococcus_DN1.PRE.6
MRKCDEITQSALKYFLRQTDNCSIAQALLNTIRSRGSCTVRLGICSNTSASCYCILISLRDFCTHCGHTCRACASAVQAALCSAPPLALGFCSDSSDHRSHN